MSRIFGDRKHSPNPDSKKASMESKRLTVYHPDMLGSTFFSIVVRRYVPKHQLSFLGIFEMWEESDSWVILENSRKVLVVELKVSDTCMMKTVPSTLQ